MINVDEIFNGFVLDHIQAGRSMAIYHYLNLDELVRWQLSKMPEAGKWEERT